MYTAEETLKNLSSCTMEENTGMAICMHI